MKRIEGMNKAQIIYCLEQITKTTCRGCPLTDQHEKCIPEDGISCEVTMIMWLLEDITPEQFITDYVLHLPHEYIHDCFMMEDDLNIYSKHFSVRLSAITEDIVQIYCSMPKGTCPDPEELCDWIRDELKQEFRYVNEKKHKKD